MARIPEEELERLKAEVSLQRLAEARGVELKRHGADLLGRCPFHDDRTPSLVISPKKNLWHCLGACQAGGSVVDWVMRSQGVSFRHAVELLRADLPLAAGSPGDRRRWARCAGWRRRWGGTPTTATRCARWWSTTSTRSSRARRCCSSSLVLALLLVVAGLVLMPRAPCHPPAWRPVPSVTTAPTRLLSDARSSYSYDNEGDLTPKTDKATGAVTTYAWNMRHQLTSITFPDGTTSTYRYDPLGRRIESNVAGVVTRDVYDGQNVRLRYDGSNTLTASFVDAGVDGHLEETQAGQRLFYLQDGSNSTVHLTNSSGTSVASYAYDSFGNPAASNSASPTNPFTYTGREFDGKSGLYYYRSRYYAADQGRFISEDPIGHLNAYTYTQNDPVDFADPSGALAVEYQALNVSMQRANVASCIGSVVGAVAGVALPASPPASTSRAPQHLRLPRQWLPGQSARA